jgi:hypothetical protein
VFVSHGSNRQVGRHLKELLEYGEYEPVVSVERAPFEPAGPLRGPIRGPVNRRDGHDESRRFVSFCVDACRLVRL